MLILALSLLSLLTVFRPTAPGRWLAALLLNSLGWSVWPLALLWVIAACLRLSERRRPHRAIRGTVLWGSLLLWLLLVTECQLIVAGRANRHLAALGQLAQGLATPLEVLPLASGHILLIALALVVARFTFRLSWPKMKRFLKTLRLTFAPYSPSQQGGIQQGRALHPIIIPRSGRNGQRGERTRAPDPTGALAGDPAPLKGHLPPLSLLAGVAGTRAGEHAEQDYSGLQAIIRETLHNYRVYAEVRPEDVSVGPTVIRFGIRPTGKPAMGKDGQGNLVQRTDAAGNVVYEQRTRVSRIMALQNDLALALQAETIRMEVSVPGRPYVGVEIPNRDSRTVTLREVLESREYQAAAGARSKVAVALGMDVTGGVRIGDLARMPHLLIAGATGSGKSMEIHAIVASILFQASPEDVRMLMIDPQAVESKAYAGLPHLLAPVAAEIEQAVGQLQTVSEEMERRYRLFAQLRIRNLEAYRRLRTGRWGQGDTSLKHLPTIVIFIDELADLMAEARAPEGLICHLAQQGRATGIHLVLATRRPSVDVLTGLIKANIPARLSMVVGSAADSRTILGAAGAERLLGRGDMLYLPAETNKPERLQGPYVDGSEVERVVAHWRRQVPGARSPLPLQ